MSDVWLEVRKRRMPARPPVPDAIRNWVSEDDLDNVETEPQLLAEITVPVEREFEADDAASQEGDAIPREISEVRRLEDYPEIQGAWLQYLVERWEPWAQEVRRWREAQDVYERVDYMRRRLEEAEERYELVLGVGLLQWQDPSGCLISRHLLTAPAEVTLDAVRGVLTVGPAVSTAGFRVELDMLELQHRPRLEAFKDELQALLEEMDIQAWDTEKVGKALRLIVNHAAADGQVDESAWRPSGHIDNTFRVLYAPALILRERRPTAYEAVIDSLLGNATSGTMPRTTRPWDELVAEGATEGRPGYGDPELDDGSGHVWGGLDGRLYFPLPTNDEQKRIVEHLRRRPHVLVKGPPGTGKSHTIANLICHLLASGERVLVTAYAPKALVILRDLLPGEIRNLCVTAFGSNREDQFLLEASIRRIISRNGEWKGRQWAQQAIASLEDELSKLEEERARLDRQLIEQREAETHRHSLPGGYEGTAAQIARRLEQERAAYDWFSIAPDPDSRCPLSATELEFLAELHPSLTEERVSALHLEAGDLELPNPEQFAKTIDILRTAEERFHALSSGMSREGLKRLRHLPLPSLEVCRSFLRDVDVRAFRSARILGDGLVVEILKDLFSGDDSRWQRLSEDAGSLLQRMDGLLRKVGNATVEPPDSIDPRSLLTDARDRLEHFRTGGWRGWGKFAPHVVRRTRYVEKDCRVDGQAARDIRSLDILVAYLELRDCLRQFATDWPAGGDLRYGDPIKAVRMAQDLARALDSLLACFRERHTDALGPIPISMRVALAEAKERQRWAHLLDVEVARREVETAKQPLQSWLEALRSLRGDGHHPCIDELTKAIEDRDLLRWRRAWETRETFREEQRHFRRYQELMDQLEQACPGLKTLLASTAGTADSQERIHHLDKAWAWAAAQAWLRRATDSSKNQALVDRRHRLQEQIEKKVLGLAELRAWDAFFSRLDEGTKQALVAWQKAIARIGKGTGKYAFRHRRAARTYLMQCIHAIPAWVMPLYRLWETAKGEPGLFDTIIIDEASQAGIDSLVLLLLGKRVIIVGDDKQNSPEAVGVLEDDIARLTHEYLRAFRFREEFRPDTSLYDHAERAFGNVISLREHFRCVPEIIRFSNELCYSEAPLIPLRQPPPGRLEPLRATFVPEGSCSGEGTRLTNCAEAERIVEAIQRCLDDGAYAGKTMGVIVLQGHAQAELIERRLAELLEPRVREERKIRCGVPATFQGDERDVVFLSLVVAPGYPYRALTGLSDQRRFNVAMSRARDQVWLFHSVQQHDLNREDLRWRLLDFFYRPRRGEESFEELDRLEREVTRLPRRLGEQPAPYDSWFEVDVALELLRRGYQVRPQYEVAGYRIDLVIEGQDRRLAVECDGDAWHGPERYEQDMARQRQLERAGWTFVRLRESEFYADRAQAVLRVLEACERLGIRTSTSSAPPPEKEGAPPDGSANPIRVAAGAYEDRAELAEDPPPEEDEPFSGYSARCGFPDPRTASSASVRSTLRNIIERDGPLTRESLYQLYVQGCPALQRVGKAVRQALGRALAAMLRAGEIVQEDELNGAPEGLVIRLTGTPSVRERPTGQRDILDIPPSELFLVLDRASASDNTLAGDDEAAARALLRHYGFTRLTVRRRRHIEKVLRVWRRRRG